MQNILSFFKKIIVALLNKLPFLILNVSVCITLGILCSVLSTNIEAIMQKRAEQLSKMSLARYKVKNAPMIINTLMLFATEKPDNLWLDQLLYQDDKKCLLSLKLKTVVINDAYSYMHQIVNKNPKIQVLYAAVNEKGFKSSADSKDQEQQRPVAFVVDYLNKKNAAAEAEKKAEEQKQASTTANKQPDYNYEANIKLSLCD